jgi:hypothetical protein
VIQTAPTLGPGIHYDVPDEVYFALPAMSATVLKAGRRSIAHMRHAMLQPKEQSDAMGLGSLTDTLVLEPEKLHDRFLIVPEFPKLNSNAGKATWADIQKEAAGRIVVDKADRRSAELMRDSLLLHPATSRWLSHEGHAQAVVIWEEPVGDELVLCKAKLDRFVPGVLKLDLKSTKNAKHWNFAGDAAKLGYLLQAGWYDHGFRMATGEKEPTPFGLAVVENEPPHLCAAYTIKPADLEVGLETCQRLLAAFTNAQRTGVWPGYSDEVEELEFPPWALRVEGPAPAMDPNDDSDIVF